MPTTEPSLPTTTGPTVKTTRATPSISTTAPTSARRHAHPGAIADARNAASDTARVQSTTDAPMMDTADETDDGDALADAIEDAIDALETAPTDGALTASVALRLPTIQDVWRAQAVIRPHVYHTPLLRSQTIGVASGAEVYLKAENLQRAGSYKIRGATNKLAQLSAEERARGVIAASAGNHSQGVAIAARALGVPCTVVMPVGAPLAKVTATQGYGAQVILFGETVDDAFAHAHAIQEQTGATFIHAFNDPAIIAGQGTVGLEILTDLPEVDVILLGIGGGGLIAGVATAVKALKPDTRIIGVEAAGAASMRAALDAGQLVTLPSINTIADGIATRSVGDYTLAITRALVDDVITVDDDEIIRAVLLLMERCKLLVEGAGAVSVAALLSGRARPFVEGKRVAAVLTGGNIDMNLVGRFIQHGLAAQGRYLVIQSLIPDRPGELLRLLNLVAEQGVNVLDIEHHRASPRLPIQQVEVTLTLETRDRAHCDALLALLHARGYTASEASSLC
ncbi:MAG TPA: threonine ammonia-lyase [Ktedonobacterales bacterium]|nr:threonine ammonia-lyase [Ktedonobacterales bacterium]